MKKICILLPLLLLSVHLYAQPEPLKLNVEDVYPSPYDVASAGAKLSLTNNSNDTVFVDNTELCSLQFISFGLKPDKYVPNVVLLMKEEEFNNIRLTLADYFPDIMFTDSAYLLIRFDSSFIKKNEPIARYQINKQSYFMILPHKTLTFYLSIKFDNLLYRIRNFNSDNIKTSLSLHVQYLTKTHRQRMAIVTSRPSAALKKAIFRPFDFER